MNFDQIFAAFYTQYRGEAQTPASTDPEYTIGLALANEAVNRWQNYDGTYWKELFTSLINEGEGTTVTVGVTDYTVPDNFKEAGGYVRLVANNGTTVRRYKIIEPQDIQFRGDHEQYAVFIGDPGNGYTMRLNPAPDAAVAGNLVDYVYYKKATLFTSGGSVTEMSAPYFVVHRMLANRFRTSRNPYYNSAKQDAEDALKTMQMDNNSGSWADPWKLADNSGTVFGQGIGDSGGLAF